MHTSILLKTKKHVLLGGAGALLALLGTLIAGTSRADDLIAREYQPSPYDCVVIEETAVTPRISMSSSCSGNYTTAQRTSIGTQVTTTSGLIPASATQCTDTLPNMSRTTLLIGEALPVSPPAGFSLAAQLVSTNQHVATVSNGLVTGISSGTTYIYASTDQTTNGALCTSKPLLVTVNPGTLQTTLVSNTSVQSTSPAVIQTTNPPPPAPTPSATCPDTLPNMTQTTLGVGDTQNVSLPAAWSVGQLVSSNSATASIANNNTLTALATGTTTVYAVNGSCRSRALMIAVNPASSVQ